MKEQSTGNEICHQQGQEKAPDDAPVTDELKILQDASQKENTNKPQTPIEPQPSPLLPPAPPATPDTRPHNQHQKLQRQSSRESSKSASTRRGNKTNSPASFAVLSNEQQNATGGEQQQDQTSPIRSSLKGATTTSVENVKSVSISESRPATSFKVLADNRSASQQPALHDQSISTDDEQPVNAATTVIAGGAAGDDERSRMKRLKKRNKSSREQQQHHQPSDRASPAVVQLSRDPDSGFEPSPRASKSKIPRAINHDQDELDGRSSRRDGFIILDEQKPVKGPRAASDGRKPGDKNACNMAVVNASIQKNIRRWVG